MHIGTTKTGSTAIQNALSQRRRELERAGVYVQNRPAKASHSLLAASVLSNLALAPRKGHPMWGGVAPETRLARFRSEFAQEMDALPSWARSCIISSEHLSNWLQHDDEVERLAALLCPFFTRIVVVVYLRRQDQHVSSGYNEILKSGIVPNIDFVQASDNVRGLDYQSLLVRYARAFGQASIMPRIFTRESLRNNNVVDDFFHTIGLDLSAADQMATNQSINAAGQHLLTQAIRRFSSKNPTGHLNTSPEWRLVTQAVETKCQGPGWRFEPAAAQLLLSSFAKSNEEVRARYFPERETLFSIMFADPAADEAPTADENINACIDVIFQLAQAHCEREAQLAMAQYRLFYRLNDQAGMRDMLRQALRYAPGHLMARLRIAELMAADGREAESLDHLDVILRLDPENKEAKKRKALLTRLRLQDVQSIGQSGEEHVKIERIAAKGRQKNRSA